MRRTKRRLPVIYADDALNDIDEIADWNEKTYSRAHARDYVRFLERNIDALANNYRMGRPLSTRADLFYVRIQKKSKANSHIAVYIFDDQAVTVIHVFHSSQDWENRLAEED